MHFFQAINCTFYRLKLSIYSRCTANLSSDFSYAPQNYFNFIESIKTTDSNGNFWFRAFIETKTCSEMSANAANDTLRLH